MATGRRVTLQLMRVAGLAVAATALVGSAATAQQQFPTSAGEALRYYESDVDGWMNGPVDYIVQLDERAIWKELETSEQRAAFIEWFWDRRDPDLREVGNKYRESFYERVADANRRFRSFPRGWKSDQGRVMCILGRPSSMSRRTWGSVYQSGSGPDFEVWTYNTLTMNLGFTTGNGDFYVYFIEERIGKFAIWDFGFRTSGIWDRNIERAFEFTLEETIQDPDISFEPRATSHDFVRAISEGTLAMAIPLDLWGAAGAGGAVSVPFAIKLSDLLFEPVGDGYVAALDAALELRAADKSVARATQAWRVQIGQEQLATVGNGSLLTALSLAAAPGSYEAAVTVTHPLAATEAEWGETVEVVDEPAAAIVVGKKALVLSDDDPSAVAILGPAEAAVDGGGAAVIGIWIRGARPDTAGLSIELDGIGMEARAVQVTGARWLEGVAGPLLIDVEIPQLEAGEYRMRVHGAGIDPLTTLVQVRR